MLNILERLRGTTKTTEKKNILAEYKDNQIVRDMLNMALNPFVTFGVANVPVHSAGSQELTASGVMVYLDILSSLKNRQLTGNNAKNKLAEFISRFDGKGQDLLVSILQKDLKAGVSIKTVNSALGKFIPEFTVQLADKFESGMQVKLPVSVEPKLDGLRCIAIKNGNNSVALFSRNGKPLEFPAIEAELSEIMADNEVFDGEIFHSKGFQSLMTQARRMHDRDEADMTDNIAYHVFDALPYQDFLKGKCALSLKARKGTVKERLAANKSSLITSTPVFTASCMEEINALYEGCVEQGYEGIMVKDPSAAYECKRSPGWLKYKPVNDFDCTILEAVEGEGKYKNMLGAFKVMQPNAVICMVGSGFTDSERADLWNSRDSLVNMTVEIQYQELSKDGVMRFPVFERLRYDK